MIAKIKSNQDDLKDDLNIVKKDCNSVKEEVGGIKTSLDNLINFIKKDQGSV